jgi:uncharacterized RmlC-like cupin family protein
VTALSDASREFGKQQQCLFPAIVCGARLSTGWLVMPPGHAAVPHVHRYHDIVVAVIEGHVASLLGDELGTVINHGPGDSIHIAPGVPHCGVNLSSVDRVVAYECRSDPTFNNDVELLPELADHALEMGERIRSEFRRQGTAQSVLDLL